jgi:hypothetical protein
MRAIDVVANERFAKKLAEAFFSAEKAPEVEVSFLVDTKEEAVLAWLFLSDAAETLRKLDVSKTVLARGYRDIELLNGSVIRIALKPELAR